MGHFKRKVISEMDDKKLSFSAALATWNGNQDNREVEMNERRKGWKSSMEEE